MKETRQTFSRFYIKRKYLYILPMSCEAKKSFSELSVIKKQISINRARGNTDLQFCSLYRKYYKIIIVCRGYQWVRSQKM